MAPLTGLTVVDFSSLLPGPLASLLLAEAGATVIKIERPGTGDEMRTYQPTFGADAVNFALLNRGKRSVAIDLKDPDGQRRVLDLITTADVLLEQFRPEVMERLGLGAGTVRERNPGLIYCSITGYGQEGPCALRTGHDLNYVGDAGLLSLSAGHDGAPVLPSALVADIAGGAYPAVINILLALLQRERTGQGARLDVAMVDNVFTFLYWAMGNGFATDAWPRAGGELLTGASPRYNLYRSSDGRWIAAAPIEDRFWLRFCALIDLPSELRDGDDPARTRTAVAECIGRRTAEEWEREFSRIDVCCSVVRDVREAISSSHATVRGLFSRTVVNQHGQRIPALPLPIDPVLRAGEADLPYPLLDADSELVTS